MTDKLLLTADVEKLTTLTRQTIHKYIIEKSFPKPSKIGNKNAWYESDVIKWIDKQMGKGKGDNE